MKAIEFKDGYLARLMRGEEVTEQLERFLKEKGIKAGSVTGIGGIENAELGYYDLPSRTYNRKIISGNLELIHYGGNITLVDGEPFIHAHAVVSGPDFIPASGHFFSAKVAITGEFIINPADWNLERKLDPSTGLKLIDL